MVRRIRLAVLQSALFLLGCETRPVFDCDRPGATCGVGARCVADRCALPNEDCVSGWEYADNAGSLAGQCVNEVEEADASPDAPSPICRERIAFYSERDNPGLFQGDVFVMETDGSEQKRLTMSMRWSDSPAWSPNGSQLAIVCDYRVCIVPAGGGAPTPVTDAGHRREFASAWSPNGLALLFSSTADDGSDYLVEKVNVDGSGRVAVTAPSGSSPQWSPSGQQIAYAFGVLQSDIWVMTADGLSPVNLTNNPKKDADPQWSPDGNQIAFVSDRDPNNGEDIFVMDSNGSNVKQLSLRDAADTSPRWSPDGSKIAFTSNNGLYVMNADGSGQVLLTEEGDPTDSDPNWLSDGQIVFTRYSGQNNGDYDLYKIASLAGSRPVRLTTSAEEDGRAAVYRCPVSPGGGD